MYKFIYFFILNRKFSEKIFIRNTELPICSNCVHFIEHTNNYPYDAKPSNERYGKCKKFGEMDMITGIIHYDLASNCRLNNNQCGKLASEFTKKSKS